MSDVQENAIAGLLIATLLAVVIGISCLYGRLVYGQWKCGLPGVQCRVEVKP